MTVTPKIGAEIAGYRLESVIERGGMAIVYVADHIRLGRKVAFKILALELSEDDRFRERFLRESRQAASINHPNIIPIYDAGEAEGVLYIAMLYVNGIDLKELLRRDGPLDLERALSIVGQAGSALDAAHANGLVHRDVKPGNILVVPRSSPEGMDHIYLSDFGLTKHKDSKSGITSTGQFVGTIDYVAPEQIEGKQVDGRVDIYSLGCVFYECLTGVTPFKKDDDIAVLWAHLREPVPSVSERRPGVPAALDAAVAKAMAKSPDERFASCLDFVAAARAAMRAAQGVGDTAGTLAAPPEGTIGADQPGNVAVVPESTQLATPPSVPSEQATSQPGSPLRPGASVETTSARDETLGPAPSPSTQPATPAPAGPLRTRRSRVLVAAALAFLVGAAAGGAVGLAFNSGHGSQTSSSQAGGQCMDIAGHPVSVGAGASLTSPAGDNLTCLLSKHIPADIRVHCQTGSGNATQLPTELGVKELGADVFLKCSVPYAGTRYNVWYLFKHDRIDVATDYILVLGKNGFEGKGLDKTVYFVNAKQTNCDAAPEIERRWYVAAHQPSGQTIAHTFTQQPGQIGIPSTGRFACWQDASQNRWIAWTDANLPVLALAEDTSGGNSRSLQYWWANMAGPGHPPHA